MNEALAKSFDNLILQQNKIDNKAYIFIGFITFIFTFIHPNGFSDGFELNSISFGLLLIALPLAISLMPIANNMTINLILFFLKCKKVKNINIFYYIDIYKLEYKEFCKVIKKEYELDQLSKTDCKLIEQILINAKILKVKVFWHNLSLIIGVGLIIITIIEKKIYS